MRRLQIIAWVALVLSGCGAGSELLVQMTFGRDAALNVALFDEGIRLSTRHVRVEITNESDEELEVAYALGALGDVEWPSGIDLRLATGVSAESATARYSAEAIRLGRFDLDPGERGTIYVNTDSPEPIAADRISIRWEG